MKNFTKIMLAAAVALSASVASAKQTDDQFCAIEAKIAEVIMKARQTGVPIGKLLAIEDEDNNYRKLIIKAYELPRMSYEENQQRMIDDFRDAHHVNCLNFMSKHNKPARKQSNSM